MWAIPSFILFLIDSLLISLFLKVIVPLSIFLRPVIASISSLCPLPSTPAIPKISPALTSIEKSFKPKTFLLFLTDRFFMKNSLIMLIITRWFI